ncbi:hypothetical protein V1522DRAFT_414588, partial [Lipomyces starkeyi]
MSGMAAAARDYLSIPASGVSRRSLWRNSLRAVTMRRLVLLGDVYKSEDLMHILFVRMLYKQPTTIYSYSTTNIRKVVIRVHLYTGVVPAGQDS